MTVGGKRRRLGIEAEEAATIGTDPERAVPIFAECIPLVFIRLRPSYCASIPRPRLRQDTDVPTGSKEPSPSRSSTHPMQ